MFFLWLILIIFLISVLIITLTIKVDIDNLIFSLPKNVQGNYINKDYKINLKIYLFGKFKIIDKEITKIEKDVQKFNERLKNMQINSTKFDIDFVRDLKHLNIKFEKMNLNLYIGLEDAAITAILVGIISSIVSLYFSNKLDNFQKQKYAIIPIYQHINILKVDFNGIIVSDLRHIINSVLIKRRVKKNGRTSNRRLNVYSNE